MSSSNSSPKPDQKLKNIVVAVEEKRTILKNPKQGYSPQEAVPERTITEVVSDRKSIERPYFGLVYYVRGAEKIMMMKNNSPRENYVLTCNICNIEFQCPNALFSHQITHTLDQVLEWQLKNLKPNNNHGQGFLMNPYNQGTSNSVFGGYSQYNPLSNEKISFGPSESIGGVRSSVKTTTFPSVNSGFTRGITDTGMSMGYHVTPYSSFIMETSNHHNVSNANHLGLSLGPFKYGGGGTSRDYPSMFSGGIPMDPLATPYSSFNGNTSYGSSSRDVLPSYRYSPHPFSLDISKLTEGSNNDSSVYPSLNGLDSITGNVPDLSHPFPSPPPLTTNLSNGENVSGSNYPLDSITSCSSPSSSSNHQSF